MVVSLLLPPPPIDPLNDLSFFCLVAFILGNIVGRSIIGTFPLSSLTSGDLASNLAPRVQDPQGLPSSYM